MFLDCDTIVTDDIKGLFTGDFEFAARPDNATFNKDWQRTIDGLDEEALPWMPNAGLVVFKKGAHQRIKDRWRKYINHSFDIDVGVKNYQDQYSLAIAVSDLSVRKLEPHYHVFEWSDEPIADGIVHHMGRYDSDLPSEIEFPLSKLYGLYQDAVPWQ